MADAVAGAILVELKAQAADLKKNFAEATTRVDAFGKAVTTNAQNIDKGGQKMADTFTAIEKRTALAQARFATFTSKVLGMQLAITSLSSGKGGLGDFGIAMESAGKGAQVAAAALHAFQGKVSLTGAAILGTGVGAVDFLTQKMRESIEATDAMTAGQIRSRLSLSQLSTSLEDAGKSAAVFGSSGLDIAQKKLQVLQSVFDGNLKRLREIPEEIAAIRQALDAEKDKPWGFRSSGKIKQFEADLESLQTERGNRERTNSDITGSAGAAGVSAALQQIGADAAKASKALSDVREIGARSLQLGIAEPAEIAAAKLQAAKARLDAIILQEIKLRDAAAMPGITDQKRAEILSQIRGLSSDVGMAQGEFLSAKSKVESLQKIDNLADAFGTSFSRSLGDAILSGKKPMAALADIGGSLFENAINQAMQQVQTGLAAAMKAISGGSEIAGGAFTAILGVGGGILAKRQSKINQSFASIQSRIESSQAVRGIVSGPSSVAISAVGENIERAFEPARQLLAQMLTELKSINRKSGGGPGSLSFGGSQATT